MHALQIIWGKVGMDGDDVECDCSLEQSFGGIGPGSTVLVSAATAN